MFNKFPVFFFLVITSIITACSSSQSDLENTPIQNIPQSSPTSKTILPTAASGLITATIPAPEITETPHKTDIPTQVSVEDSVQLSNRNVSETLLFVFDPDETNPFNLKMSPDGKQVAYTKITEKGEFVVIGWEEFGPYDNVTIPLFGPDSQHWAYIATLEGAQFVDFNGVEQSR